VEVIEYFTPLECVSNCLFYKYATPTAEERIDNTRLSDIWMI